MGNDLLFETNRFNLSEVKEHFINPCCFGEDLAAWLCARLLEREAEVTGPGQEDWGWYLEANNQGRRYFIGVGGNADESSADKDQGEWRIIVERRRSVWEKLTGEGEMTEADEMVTLIREILRREPDFQNVRYEAGA